MSRDSDPNEIRRAIDTALDAFNEEGRGMPTPEDAIDTDADWKSQLTKGCRLLAAIELIAGDGYHTATIELAFGAIERSLEAYALSEGGDDLEDFHGHTHCYERVRALGLFSRETARDLEGLYDNNRTDSYYGGRRPTQEQAEAMRALSGSIHAFTTDQIREGRVCTCDREDSG